MAKKMTNRKNKRKSTLKRLTGMWLNEKNGKKYFRGKTIDGVVFVMFWNEDKEEDNEPDAILYVDTDTLDEDLSIQI